MTATKVRSLFIQGREWHDKRNGQHYWSVCVWVNGEALLQDGISFGYGDQYIHDTLQYLFKEGILPTNRVSALRNCDIDFYSSKSQVTKKEMFQPWFEETRLNKYRYHQHDVDCECARCCLCADCDQVTCDC